MLRVSFTFLAVALISAVLALTNPAFDKADIAAGFFYFFILVSGIVFLAELFLVKKK